MKPDPAPRWPARMREPDDKFGPVLGENLRAARLGFGWVGPLGAWLRVSDSGPGWLLELRLSGGLPGGREGRPITHRMWWLDPEGPGALIAAIRGAFGVAGHVDQPYTVVIDDDGAPMEVSA